MIASIAEKDSKLFADGAQPLLGETGVTKSDRVASLKAGEFLWDMAQMTAAGHLIAPPLLKHLRQLNPRNILDLGCGNGALSAWLAEQGFSVRGTDMSQSGIAIAQKTYPKVAFFSSELGQPLADEHRKRYEVVISTEVIEHLLFPRQVFERAREALAPGGTLIVTTPYHGYWKNLALALTGKCDTHWHPLKDFGHIKFFSIATLSSLFVEEKFKVLNVERLGRIPPLAKSMLMVGKMEI